jgi:hypothetical protein
VNDLGVFEQFRRYQLASNAQAIRVQTPRAVDNNPIEEEIRKLLLGEYAGHGVLPPLKARVAG